VSRAGAGDAIYRDRLWVRCLEFCTSLDPSVLGHFGLRVFWATDAYGCTVLRCGITTRDGGCAGHFRTERLVACRRAVGGFAVNVVWAVAAAAAVPASDALLYGALPDCGWVFVRSTDYASAALLLCCS